MCEDNISEIERKSLAFFGADTPLRDAVAYGGRAYEPRVQQQEMASLVASHLARSKHLCIEAPTGVGKTFAYLIPAIYLAMERKMPVVISTHTISLQEQIIKSDIPILRKLMGLDIDAAIALGRGNYVCRRRLSSVVNEQKDVLPSFKLMPQLEEIYEWAEVSGDGCKKSLAFEPDGRLWDMICCEFSNCLGGRCVYFRSCFLLRAKIRVSKANLIVANHALFFADMSLKAEGDGEKDSDGMGILPPFVAVVLDEGHTIEDTAASHLGVRITAFNLRRILNKLYNPRSSYGLLSGHNCLEARQAVVAAHERMEFFFKRIDSWLGKQADNPLRYTSPGHVPDMIGGDLSKVVGLLKELVGMEENDDRKEELRAVGLQLAEYQVSLNNFLEMRFGNHVYWFERQGEDLQHLSMNMVPIDLAPLLSSLLFKQNYCVIVTSATLAINNNISYFQRRIGAYDAASVILSSPFDFAKQVTLYMPYEMPNPNNLAEFIPLACEKIRHFLLQSEGKAFVLFTSYRMMYEVAERMDDFFVNSGLRLFVQGRDLQVSDMVKAFQADMDSVIFGTSIFWTGIDVPGDSLSNVIIVKLPFAVPNHPLVAARQELIELSGGRSFMDYSLPEAVLKFRQGFGRLIRSKDDKGIVVVLDNRIVKKSYGKIFLDSIPVCKRILF